MRSDIIKKGFERAPHARCSAPPAPSNPKPTGTSRSSPSNSYTDCIPAHAPQNSAELVKRPACAKPAGVAFIFNSMGGHRASPWPFPACCIAATRANFIVPIMRRDMLKAHCFDGMVCIPNCDKIVPGM